jgi:amino acid transporter
LHQLLLSKGLPMKHAKVTADYNPDPVLDGLRPADKLEPDAIGVAQDTVIGMASAAPGVSVGLTLAALAAASAYSGGLVIIVTAIPMLIIANAYRRLNLWSANCGASFEWVGRSISPYLGFITGWIMIAAYVTGAVSGVEVIGPSVLAVITRQAPGGRWPVIAIATGITLVMLVIAVVGIRLTARTQVGMAAIEYSILVVFAIIGLVLVLRHRPGTFPISAGWFSLHGVGGHGSLAAGVLIAVYAYSGWDGTLYVNEEVKHRRVNPGRAAIIAVLILTALYELVIVGLQGVVSPAQLQAHSSDALVYVASAIGGSGWARVMAVALALSVIAATGTSIVLTARIILGMASYHTLPSHLANVSRRFVTPVNASVLTGVLIVVLVCVYFLATSVQGAFTYIVNTSGLLFGAFYILTALATITYYRRRIVSNFRDAITLGILPIGAAVFLGWALLKSSLAAVAAQNLSLLGILVAGGVLLAIARLKWRSPFFGLARESDSGSGVDA